MMFEEGESVITLSTLNDYTLRISIESKYGLEGIILEEVEQVNELIEKLQVHIDLVEAQNSTLQ